MRDHLRVHQTFTASRAIELDQLDKSLHSSVHIDRNLLTVARGARPWLFGLDTRFTHKHGAILVVTLVSLNYNG